MRKKILAGNWKMNLGPKEAESYFSAIVKELRILDAQKPSPGIERVIFPPAYALGIDVQDHGKASHIAIGAQNVHWEDKGAFTGELSATALKAIGIEWVLIGHSERRQFFGETDATAAKRLINAAKNGLHIVYCLGETLAERESGQTEAVLTKQVTAFAEARVSLLNSIISIAYEPVWAIGTGKTATTEQANDAHRHIRKEIARLVDQKTAEQLPILYGGSVTPENASVLLKQSDIDGVLVGGASLKPDGFAKILASVTELG